MPTRPLVTDYEDDLKLFPDAWHRVGWVLGGTFLLLFPFLADAHWLAVGNLALVTVVGSVGLMVLTGYTGQISLGHAAFLALGAYTTAVLSSRFGMPVWVVLPAAGTVAALVGLAIGPFALRLEGLYLAIVTLGLLFVVNHVLLSLPGLTGGVSGISVPIRLGFETADPGALRTPFSGDWRLGPLLLTLERKLFFMFLVLAAATALAATNIARSDLGRAMMAVRDHDVAAEVMGVNPARAKVISFGISSFMAGIAGAMFAIQQQFITVDPPFNLLLSVQYIAMIVLGGIGTVFGAVAGAVAFTVLSPLSETFAAAVPYLRALSSSQQSTLLFAVVVILFLLFEPLGLFGIWLRIKRYFQAWPFSY